MTSLLSHFLCLISKAASYSRESVTGLGSGTVWAAVRLQPGPRYPHPGPSANTADASWEPGLGNREQPRARLALGG